MKQFLLQKLFSIYRAIFARRCFARWNRLLFQLSLRGLGVLNYGDKISGEEHFLRRFAKRGGTLVVLDVGANEGQYARALKAHAPQSIVYAFEPHPRTFERLQEQAQRHSFTALNLACGSKPDRLTLYDYQDHPEGSQHASLHQGVIEQIHRGVAKSWEVQVTTVDEFLRQGHIQKVNLLKVDTEGHEYEVLMGASDAIARGTIEIIHIEFNEMNVISRVFCRDFYKLLTNYDFFRMLPDGLFPLGPYTPLSCELFAYQNMVAILRGHEAPNV